MQQTNGSVNSKGFPRTLNIFPLGDWKCLPGVDSSFLLKT